MQGHQLQMLQQPQLPSVHAHYQAQQQELSQSRQQLVEHAQPHVIHQQGDVSSQQQQDLGMSLQEYFKDPKAITSLLSNKEELCRLLEQNPKLMQMLQNKSESRHHFTLIAVQSWLLNEPKLVLGRLRKPFPPIRSVLGETKSLQFSIDNEAFQDCWCNRLLRIVSNCFCDDLAVRNCNCNCFCDDLAARNYDLVARNCFCDDFA
ncbi:hypothetical protein NC652_036429 [Populus alba x Populus x berolinensis]|nr:hypothetical protein NC652_036429 [Populus alba x Populus x berolinensis]